MKIYYATAAGNKDHSKSAVLILVVVLGLGLPRGLPAAPRDQRVKAASQPSYVNRLALLEEEDSESLFEKPPGYIQSRSRSNI